MTGLIFPHFSTDSPTRTLRLLPENFAKETEISERHDSKPEDEYGSRPGEMQHEKVVIERCLSFRQRAQRPHGGADHGGQTGAHQVSIGDAPADGEDDDAGGEDDGAADGVHAAVRQFAELKEFVR